MAFTGENVEADARLVLNDSDLSNQRYKSTEHMLPWINEFVRMIWNKAPASRFAATGELNTYAALTAITGATPFTDDKWRDALVDGVCVRAFEGEGKDDSDLDRAKHHATRFTAATGIPLIVRV